MERGAWWGQGGKAAEPHPVTCSSLAGRQAGKALVWLSFINLTACAKAPVLELIKQAPSHTPQSCGSPRDSCGGAHCSSGAGVPHTHIQRYIHAHKHKHTAHAHTLTHYQTLVLQNQLEVYFCWEFNLTGVDHQPFDV